MGDVVLFPTGYEPWLSSAELAQHFRVSTRTVGRWVDAGMPCAVPPGGGRRRFRVSECEAWMATGRSTA